MESWKDCYGKKLLILGGASVHVKVVEAAREMGVRTVVADYLPIEGSPGKQIADEHLEVNIFDTDRLVDYCRANGVDGVLGFCIDPTQRPAQEIAERIGAPAFGTREQVWALTDKNLFKQMCLESGVDVIQSFTEEAARSGQAGFPLLVKPTDSRGSRGARVCRNCDELAEAIPFAKGFSSDGRCIIERHMSAETCQDLTISYLVKDGEPVLVSLGDRHSGRPEDNLDRQLICTIQPSRFAAEYLEKADERIKGLIRHIGLKNGPVFFQGFWDGETVRLYDPGLRYPGNEYERILERATGVNLMKIVIAYCVTGVVPMPASVPGCWRLNGKTCLQYMVNVGAGRIGRFEGLDAIAQAPEIVDVRQKHFVGDLIEPTGDVRHRAAEISVLCDRGLEPMKRSLARIHKTVSCVDETGCNQLISPFGETILNRWYRNY